MVASSEADSSETPAIPPQLALADAAKLIQAAAGVEETRFNNLNSRAIALLSATSLVTALAALFSKELFVDIKKLLDAGQVDATKPGVGRYVVTLALVAALLLLVLVAIVLVWGVLMPNRRATFGNNKLTNSPETLDDHYAVHTVTFSEYYQIHNSLVLRNKSKATALHLAYWLFVAAVVVIALDAAFVAVNSL